MNEIKDFSFSKEGIESIKETKFGLNWPVVYILNNDNQAYVGESSNVFYRTKNHLRNQERKGLKNVHIIYNDKFNKSAILDIEAMLIQYMSADNKCLLQNRNSGQSQAHDYYQRQMYVNTFEEIWKELKKQGLVDKNLEVIKNSDLFKFSPYKTLTTDQFETSQEIAFDKTNTLLGLSKEGTELDWILKSSKKQILFYDKNQTVKPSDVTVDFFKNSIYMQDYEMYHLSSQMRVKGGKEYMKYIKDVLDCKEIEERKKFDDYDLKLYTDIEEMVAEIRNKNEIYGLSRMVAGYSWPWATKNNTIEEIQSQGLYDIEIEGHRYVWNHFLNDWVNTPNSINEVGCIHTIQGYDLNYTGVIIGQEVTYNKETKSIEIITENYYDKKGKAGVKDIEDLKKYIINIYKVLLTRGIRGTYIYVCDDNLREYLQKFIA